MRNHSFQQPSAETPNQSHDNLNDVASTWRTTGNRLTSSSLVSVKRFCVALKMQRKLGVARRGYLVRDHCQYPPRATPSFLCTLKAAQKCFADTGREPLVKWSLAILYVSYSRYRSSIKHHRVSLGFRPREDRYRSFSRAP